MITRQITKQIADFLQENRKEAVFMWGPRRAGKTTILHELHRQFDGKMFNFDIIADREQFVNKPLAIKALVATKGFIFIDEVQNFPEATVVIKILIDEYGKKIIATGSSELRAMAGREYDSLAGRYFTWYCYPLALRELESTEQEPLFTVSGKTQILEKSTTYGTYPEVYLEQDIKLKRAKLQNILANYVLKDIVQIYNLRDLALAQSILFKMALQIGQEVSLRKLAADLGCSVITLSNYIEILTKNYILIQHPSFKTNLKNAVGNAKKYFFADLGLRNEILNDFRPLHLRPDKGFVFENYIISELYKKNSITQAQDRFYFYREYKTGKEIDIVCESPEKQYELYEIKYKAGKTSKIFPIPHKLSTVTTENFDEFI